MTAGSNASSLLGLEAVSVSGGYVVGVGMVVVALNRDTRSMNPQLGRSVSSSGLHQFVSREFLYQFPLQDPSPGKYGPLVCTLLHVCNLTAKPAGATKQVSQAHLGNNITYTLPTSERKKKKLPQLKREPSPSENPPELPNEAS